MAVTAHFSIGQAVIVDERSEHYPGALVYIVDSMPGEAYGHCVATTKETDSLPDCQWVKTEYLREATPAEIHTARTVAPTRMLHCAICNADWRQKSTTPPKSCARCGSERWRGNSKWKGAGDPFEIGDPVVARDDTNFTMLPEVGYVAEVDDGMIGIAYEKGKSPDILVSRRFVRHA